MFLLFKHTTGRFKEKVLTEQVQQWRLLQNGEQTALAYFFRAYYEEMYHYGRALLRDDTYAEDQVQQFFLKLWEKHSTLPTPSNIKAYLFRSLRFALIDELRRRKRSRIVLLAGDDRFFEWQEAHSPISGDTPQVRAVLKSLSATQQEIIFLRFYNQLPYPEIAAIMGMQYQSVRNAAHRAIKKMRTLLKKDHLA